MRDSPTPRARCSSPKAMKSPKHCCIGCGIYLVQKNCANRLLSCRPPTNQLEELPVSHTVLFVDDDFRILQALVRRMHKEAFEIRTATSAEEALRILDSSHVDLMVS